MDNIKYEKGKGKLLLKIEEIFGGKAHTNTQKLIQNISMITDVFTFTLIWYIYSLLIYLLSSDWERHLWSSKYFMCLCVPFLGRSLQISVRVFPFFSHILYRGTWLEIGNYVIPTMIFVPSNLLNPTSPQWNTANTQGWLLKRWLL